jgi:hypothetical protein
LGVLLSIYLHLALILCHYILYVDHSQTHRGVIDWLSLKKEGIIEEYHGLHTNRQPTPRLLNIKALYIGSDVSRHYFHGVVHSVFDDACNLAAKKNRSKSSAIISLLSRRIGNIPHGIKLDTPKGFSFKDYLKSDDVIVCQRGIIRFRGSCLSIDLREANRWDRRISMFHADLKNPCIMTSWLRTCQRVMARAYEMTPEALPFVLPLLGILNGEFGFKHGLPARIQKRVAGNSFLTELSSVVEKKVSALVETTKNMDIRRFVRILGDLIGLGPGLTPTGDDFITGFLAGLFCTSGNDPARLHLLKVLNYKSHAIFNMTNEISRAFLSHAAQGRFCESVVCLVEHMSTSRSVLSLNKAIENVLNTGSTSGIATTTGLLVGLITWGYNKSQKRGVQS